MVLLVSSQKGIRPYLKAIYAQALGMYGGLNRDGPHRLTCLKAWPTGGGTISRCGLDEGSMSLWGP